MIFKIRKTVYVCLVLFLFNLNSYHANARIRLRKVKDTPKVCAELKEDKILSKDERKIFSTERTSLIFQDEVSVLNDLGQKICSWKSDEWNRTWSELGGVESLTYFIDEQKNKLYSYKEFNSETIYRLSDLDNCDLGQINHTQEFKLPECKKNKKVKKSRKSNKKKSSKEK